MLFFHFCKMQNIENIIFDLGGVILNLDNRRTEDAFVAMGAKNFGENFGHGFAASFFRDYEIGSISDQQFLADLKKLINSPVSDETIIHAWNALLLDFPPARIRLLQELRNRYRLFLFSNTNALHLAALKKIYTESFGKGSLDNHFEKTYYSHLIGLRKPDLASYKYIIDQNKIQPEKTLFVDDALINIKGAIAAGLQGFYLKPGMDLINIPF
jgi:glucose-1-phosphatase